MGTMSSQGRALPPRNRALSYDPAVPPSTTRAEGASNFLPLPPHIGGAPPPPPHPPRPHVCASIAATNEGYPHAPSAKGVTTLPDDPRKASFQTSASASRTGRLWRGHASTKCTSRSCAPAMTWRTTPHPNTTERGRRPAAVKVVNASQRECSGSRKTLSGFMDWACRSSAVTRSMCFETTISFRFRLETRSRSSQLWRMPMDAVVSSSPRRLIVTTMVDAGCRSAIAEAAEAGSTDETNRIRRVGATL
mmetsp:Transcript_21590/g.63354  ORF Transcript_21590/g.63354 Transcript_21590/m.63354 type:complete len:249 (-) Transcript_21590:11-757(-)